MIVDIRFIVMSALYKQPPAKGKFKRTAVVKANFVSYLPGLFKSSTKFGILSKCRGGGIQGIRPLGKHGPFGDVGFCSDVSE